MRTIGSYAGEITPGLSDASTRTLGDHWFMPLARNPPSTTSKCPVTKLAAGEARKTVAPTNSDNSPKRRIGVRIKHSSPRPVLSSKAAFRSVRKTPGTNAFTHTPWRAHSTASDLVSDATADLLTA